MWGDGEQRRELIYVQDAVDAILNLLKYDNEIFNLGSGSDYTINEFAQEVCRVYGYDYSLVERDLTKYVGVREKKLDTAKVISYLKDSEYLKTSLPQGLQKSIEYFRRAHG